LNDGEGWRYRSGRVMSESEKRQFDASKTIQLDADDVELIKFHASRPPALPAESVRPTPPPLPSEGYAPPAEFVPNAPAGLPALETSPPEQRSLWKSIAYAASLLALLVMAVAFGMMVGSRVGAARANATATPTRPANAPASAAAPERPAPPASTRTLLLPTIEIKKQ
jgi:hypothetical protein